MSAEVFGAVLKRVKKVPTVQLVARDGYFSIPYFNTQFRNQYSSICDGYTNFRYWYLFQNRYWYNWYLTSLEYKLYRLHQRPEVHEVGFAQTQALIGQCSKNLCEQYSSWISACNTRRLQQDKLITQTHNLTNYFSQLHFTFHNYGRQNGIEK